MKTVFIGDIHGRKIWKDILYQENLNINDTVVFIGDYFDSHDLNITGKMQLDNFIDIINTVKSNNFKVVLLIGNHDYHYIIKDQNYSGFQPNMFESFNYLLNDNKELFQMCYANDGYICSHAGISNDWFNSMVEKFEPSDINSIKSKAEFINDIWKYNPKAFRFKPELGDIYGNHSLQSPIWIRPDALNKANEGNNIWGKQIIGHTYNPYMMCDFSQDYYLIDSLDDNYYLVNENNNFIKKLLR